MTSRLKFASVRSPTINPATLEAVGLLYCRPSWLLSDRMRIWNCACGYSLYLSFAIRNDLTETLCSSSISDIPCTISVSTSSCIPLLILFFISHYRYHINIVV
ncbi:hypothetical protein EJD97_020094 [Solanum chilense]|uniref:Uncharacterized protein n=1 Tax=Solanum chilense TaxID=4083 RepID=A0A6N2C8R9_SOLCI|nr:hypothetical protein EJD97_020094 [Solanum chilense]